MPSPRGRGRQRPAGYAGTVPVITTYREGSLHAALKARYAAAIPGATVEAAVDGFVIDVVGPDELVEIQTASFASASRKLARLVEAHRVVLVHPIPVEKWLVRIDEDGVVLRRGRSPRRGQPLDLFEELVHVPALLIATGFRIEVVLTVEEEIRGPIPPGTRRRYPRDWQRLDRRLVDVVATIRVDTPEDLLALLPAGLPEPFTTADIVAASRRSSRLAQRAAYCLERSGVAERTGRRGRFVTYSRSALPLPPDPAGPLDPATAAEAPRAAWPASGQVRPASGEIRPASGEVRPAGE